MFRQVGDKLFITRGDTGVINLSIRQSVKPYEEYELQPGDSIVFSVKKNIDDTTYAFQKTFMDKEIRIKPTDTKNLEFGDYWYDIELRYEGGDRHTIIPPTLFRIEKEVTTE